MPIIQNNHQNFYENFKKIFNNPISKFSLGFVVSSFIATITAKLIYDKIKNLDKIQLTPADVAWIKKNIILIEQDYPLCWHNAFMQFLACPEILYKNYKSEKIMIMIRWIREKLKELNKNYNGDYLDRKIKLKIINDAKDRSFRRAPDGLEYKLKLEKIESSGDKAKSVGYLFSNVDTIDVIRKWDGLNEFELGLLDGYMGYYDDYSIAKNWELDPGETIEDATFSHIYDKNKNIIDKNKKLIKDSMNFICSTGSKSRINSNILGFFQNYNLYPTFIIVYDNINYNELHAHVCYIVYNKNKKPKFFIWCDGIKNKIIIRPAEESIKKIKNYKKKYIKYSTGDIVEKFYVPEA